LIMLRDVPVGAWNAPYLWMICTGTMERLCRTACLAMVGQGPTLTWFV
jgi:hypothetical protein